MTYEEFLVEIDELYAVGAWVQISDYKLAIDYDVYRAAAAAGYIYLYRFQNHYMRVLKKPNIKSVKLNKFSTMEPVTESDLRAYFG